MSGNKVRMAHCSELCATRRSESRLVCVEWGSNCNSNARRCAKSSGAARVPPAKSDKPFAASFKIFKSALALNTSKFVGIRFGATVGPGEIAIVAATGSRSAIRIAIVPPIECPTRIVVFGSIACA